MDQRSNSVEGVGARPGWGQRWTPVKVGAGLAGVGVMLLLLWFGLSARLRPVERFSWLTPSEYGLALQPGPFTKLRDQVLRLTGPVYRWVFGSRTQVLIDCRLLALTAPAAQQTGLGLPLATNAAGQRAWMLSAEAYEGLGRRLKGLPGALELNRPRIQTSDGCQASLFTGETLALGGRQVPVGLSIDLLPKATGGAFKLLVRVTSTRAAAAPEAGSPRIQINFDAVCRALVPNGGGLAIAGGGAGVGETNYCFILSTVAVDASGKPLKQRRSNTVKRAGP